jgi:hypothetical protein
VMSRLKVTTPHSMSTQSMWYEKGEGSTETRAVRTQLG